MITLWASLLVLHQAYALMPVLQVQIGEPATFTCVLPSEKISHRKLYWYKQSPGGIPRLIVTLTVKSHQKPLITKFSAKFSDSKWKVKYEKKISYLTYLKTTQEDEGAYLCEITEWFGSSEWSGTYLIVKDSSVHSGSDLLCSGDLSVFWFRTESGSSHPDILTDGKQREECEKRSDKRSCFYHFPKSFLSDAGSYYCAVATCGETLAGNVTEVKTDTLMPVMPVQLGEPATFKCILLNEFSQRDVYWYRQGPGDTLRPIVKLTVRQQKSTSVEFAPDCLNSRWTVNYENKCSRLTIMRTTEDDEGAYHCAVMGWNRVNEWSGTYLLVEGNTVRTSNYTVVHLPTASDPTGPGDSETLQCSVFSDSDQTCSDLSVFWFRTESGSSRPDVLYTDGKQREKRSDKRSCFYHKFSSSDAGTFHCAVATCGRILIGNVTEEKIEETADFTFTTILTLITCLLISVIINIVFICYQTPRSSRETNENTPRQTRHHKMTRQRPETVEDVENYAALCFSEGKAKRGRKKRSIPTEESIYSQLKL